MNTLTKLASSWVGRLRPLESQALASDVLALPPPLQAGGMPLLEALAARQSTRDFRPDALPLPVLSSLLWAAYGINRAKSGGRMVPVGLRGIYAAASAGAICQNVYLFCAATGLATVVRGWFDRKALAQALSLGRDQEIVLAQTVGYPGDGKQPRALGGEA